MSSWRYAFLFPRLPDRLHPANGVKHLAEIGADYDRSIRLCIQIDDEGHLLDVGEEIPLTDPIERDIIHHLEDNESFSVQLRSIALAFSVQFILNSPNPHISIGWSRRLFDASPPELQRAVWKAIRLFAKDCNAGYVVVVDDAPDHFEDRFIDIDGRRVFDLKVNHSYGLGLKEVWLQTCEPSALPEGATYGDPAQIGEGFERRAVII